MMNRTDAYVMTVKLTNGKCDDERLQLLRTLVRLANKNTGSKKYVKLQGRGPRLGIRRYNQALPLKLAERADVYVYERSAY